MTTQLDMFRHSTLLMLGQIPTGRRWLGENAGGGSQHQVLGTQVLDLGVALQPDEGALLYKSQGAVLLLHLNPLKPLPGPFIGEVLVKNIGKKRAMQGQMMDVNKCCHK